MLDLQAMLSAMPETYRRRLVERPYRKDTPIVLKGEAPTCIFFLLEGKGRVSNEFEDGRRYSFAELVAPDIVGEYEAMAGAPAYAATCETTTPCRIVEMAASDFCAWLREDGAAAYEIACLIARKSYPTSNMAGGIKYTTTEQRLAAFLLRRLSGMTGNIRLSSSRQEIADEIGTSVKTVNRTIAKMREEGKIDILHGKLVVTEEQRQALKEFLEEV